jgi:hypothetical protein
MPSAVFSLRASAALTTQASWRPEDSMCQSSPGREGSRCKTGAAPATVTGDKTGKPLHGCFDPSPGVVERRFPGDGSAVWEGPGVA